MIFFGRTFGRPVATTTTTSTRVSTTTSNGVISTVRTNSFVTTLRRRYGYVSVSTSASFSTSVSRGTVWQAPPTVNNPAPSQTPAVQQSLRQRTSNSAMAYVQPAVPASGTSTTVTSSVTTTVVRPIRPRWRLIPVGWGRWVWRRF